MDEAVTVIIQKVCRMELFLRSSPPRSKVEGGGSLLKEHLAAHVSTGSEKLRPPDGAFCVT